MPFAVSISRVQQVIGSRDKELAELLKDTFSHQFEQDELEDEDVGEDEDEPPLPLEEALDEIIEGKELREAQGYKYGTVVEVLCWHFGTFLPNAEFSGMRRQQDHLPCLQ